MIIKTEANKTFSIKLKTLVKSNSLNNTSNKKNTIVGTKNIVNKPDLTIFMNILM